jgi:hypothetical protein
MVRKVRIVRGAVRKLSGVTGTDSLDAAYSFNAPKHLVQAIFALGDYSHSVDDNDFQFA